MADQRSYDIVLIGATGFTGGLTAEYLAANAPSELRWAIAGRNRSKLEAVRQRLVAIKPELNELPLLEADVNDEASLDELTASTRVIITTVGPYALYGEKLVAACAKNGTDYTDLTGEPEFVDRTFNRYDEIARKSGARLIHCCGFDSIPHDVGAYFTVLQLPEDQPISVDGFVRAGGNFSGGTFHSAVTAFSRGKQNLQEARTRRSKETNSSGRKASMSAKPLRRERELGGWAVTMPTVDPQIVVRSARAVPRYGPEFSYGHYLLAKRLSSIAGLTAGVGGLIAAAQIGPLRERILKVRQPGEGPSEQERAKSWFTVTFLGEAGASKVKTRVSGGDPGYSETAKMLAESALCLALDELPQTSGQQTTVSAMGNALLKRLQAAGIKFEVLESS